MTQPLFASKWFKDVPAVELRQEIQNLYREIARLKGEEPEPVDLGPIEGSIADLEAALTGYLPLVGGTLTGPLSIENASSMSWTNNGGNVVLNFGGGGAGFIRNGVAGSSLNISGGTSSTSGPNVHLDHGASNGVLRYNGTNRLLWDANGVYLAASGTTTTSAVRADRTISAGNGLTGGGDLTANRSLALGTPSSISPTTTNNVSASSHTHAISWPDTLGAVGSWAFMITQNGAAVNPGSTVAGSGLRYAAANGQSASSPTPSGTWRAMGYKDTGNVGASVFVRIS